MPKIALDTSVIIEYIDKKSEFQNQAKAVFAALINGTLEAIIPHPVLSETYYVTSKIYKKLGISNPQELSSELIEWLFRLPSVTVPAEDKDLAVETGKAKLENCIALTDCYVLATSKIYSCKALFKKPEQEMLQKLNRLKKSYQLIFLADYQ